ncbi:hypothetical protein F6476_26735 [Pseudomonas umsongensis]|jgi:hypothetical protein|uniref:hypothetical protein n=1 Tax=Pseudomonas umsongensis TaxID=198618 RepID=UPI0012466D7A|nr:hypothetical protein [Pseudomonas umsongensis]QFG32502.1 hypothetical protein F6476_26735 [Pseudomonas umsongensis]
MTDNLSRSDTARAGVLALQQLFSQIIKTPDPHIGDAGLLAALKTQGGIASLDRAVAGVGGEELHTVPTSLNTLKKYSDEILIGGFTSLNALRTKAIEAIERQERKKAKSNKRTKAGLALRVTDHERELEMLRQTNFLLLRALQESMTKIKNISKASDPLTREIWASDAIAELLAITSFGIPPFNLIEAPEKTKSSHSTVTDINEYRN